MFTKSNRCQVCFIPCLIRLAGYIPVEAWHSKEKQALILFFTLIKTLCYWIHRHAQFKTFTLVDCWRRIVDCNILKVTYLFTLQIYVDTSEEPHDDADGTFQMSRMRKLIEIHLNTIRIYITIPSHTEVVKFMQKERNRKPLPEPKCEYSSL